MKVLLLVSHEITEREEVIRLLDIYINKYFKQKTNIIYAIIQFKHDEDHFNWIKEYLEDRKYKYKEFVSPNLYINDGKRNLKELGKASSSFIDKILILANNKSFMIQQFIKILYKRAERLQSNTILVDLLPRYDGTLVDVEVDQIWKDVPKIEHGKNKKREAVRRIIDEFKNSEIRTWWRFII